MGQIPHDAQLLNVIAGKIFAIDREAGCVILLPERAWRLYKASNEKYYKRVETELSRRGSGRRSEAKFNPGLESLPWLDAALFGRQGLTKLRRHDVIRCKENLAAAILLAAIRGKIRYWRKKIINRTDVQLSADTGLPVRTVQRAREFLVEKKLLQAWRDRNEHVDWPQFHYCLPVRNRSKH